MVSRAGVYQYEYLTPVSFGSMGHLVLGPSGLVWSMPYLIMPDLSIA